MPNIDHDVQAVLSSLRIPVMPQILLRLLDLCHLEETSVAKLAELIVYDPGMAAKVIRVATTPAYSRSPQPPSLQRALLTIGVDMVNKLLITESIHQTIKQLPVTSEIDLRKFWSNSIATALAAQWLARKFAYPNAEEAYLAGLFRNIGRLLLVSAMPSKYSALFHEKDDLGLLAMEKKLLQLTHAEAGAWLVEQWQLDSFIADSVRFHHEPIAQLATAHPLVRIVAIAGHVVHHLHNTDEAAVVESIVGFEKSDLELMRQFILVDRERIATQLGIDLSALHDISVPAEVSSTQEALCSKEALRQKAIDLALVSSVSASLGEEEDIDSCVRSIIGSAVILFDVSDGLVFRLNATRNALIPVGTVEGRRRLAGMEIPLVGESGLTGAMKNAEAVFITNSSANDVGTKQLLALLETDCLMTMPMHAVGMLVFSIRLSQVATLAVRAGMFPHFASQARSALSRFEKKPADDDQTLAALYKMEAHRFAHEVNTPLAIIKNYLSVLDRRLGSESARHEFAMLNEEIDRVGALVKNFAQFQEAVESTSCMLHVEMRRSVEIWSAGGLMNAKTTVTVSADPPDVCVAINAGVLRQVILNLLKNAAEALPPCTAIVVSHREIINRGGRIYAVMTVADNGPGIPQPLFMKLFSPGVTSKAGENRGLGLSIVQRLIQATEGEIDCRTDQNGTRFQLLLPIVANAQPPAGSTAAVDIQGNGTVT